MAQVSKHIEAEVADKVGRLAEVTDKLKDAGVNIVAMLAWVEDGTGKLRMVVDDTDKACAAVTDMLDKCECGEVVCASVPNTPGALNEIAHKLADAGIAVHLVYATAGNGTEATIALVTDNNAKAAQII